MKNQRFQALVAAVSGFLSSVLGILYIPVLLMVSANIIDYVTGLMAAKHREDGTISSYRSIKGIKKKVGMWILVLVGAMVDELIVYSCVTLGIALPFQFAVACVVAVWIVCNEFISILENLKDIGTNIPAFMIPLIKNVRSQAEGKVIVKKEEENDGEKESN